MILRFLKIILIVAVILVITISIILLLLSMQPFVPNNYTQIVKTGGELEAKYLAMGASQVEHMEVSTEEEWGNINVYYPKELTESAKSYPVVVMVNGTGVYSSNIQHSSSIWLRGDSSSLAMKTQALALAVRQIRRWHGF